MNENERELEIEAAGIIKRILSKPVKRRKFYDYALLEDMLKRIKYFKDRNFTLQELTEISKLLLPAEFKKGSIIFDQQNHGLGFYIILIGEVSVEIPVKEESGNFQEIALLEIGSSFIESAFKRRSVQALAVEDTYCAYITKENFNNIIKKKEEKRIKEMVSLLLGNPYFSSCNPKNISYIQYYFSQKAYLRGQIICNVGDLVKNVYFVQEGELDVQMSICRQTQNHKQMIQRRGENEESKAKRGAIGLGKILKLKEGNQISNNLIAEINNDTFKDEMIEISVKKIGKGELFGEVDLFNNRPKYTATLKCISCTAKIYVISAYNFNKWVRNLPNVNSNLENEIPIREKRTTEFIFLYQQQKYSKIYHDPHEMEVPDPDSELDIDASQLQKIDEKYEDLYNKPATQAGNKQEIKQENKEIIYFKNSHLNHISINLNQEEGKRRIKFRSKLGGINNWNYPNSIDRKELMLDISRPMTSRNQHNRALSNNFSDGIFLKYTKNMNNISPIKRKTLIKYPIFERKDCESVEAENKKSKLQGAGKGEIVNIQKVKKEGCRVVNRREDIQMKTEEIISNNIRTKSERGKIVSLNWRENNNKDVNINMGVENKLINNKRERRLLMNINEDKLSKMLRKYMENTPLTVYKNKERSREKMTDPECNGRSIKIYKESKFAQNKPITTIHQTSARGINRIFPLSSRDGNSRNSPPCLSHQNHQTNLSKDFIKGGFSPKCRPNSINNSESVRSRGKKSGEIYNKSSESSSWGMFGRFNSDLRSYFLNLENNYYGQLAFRREKEVLGGGFLNLNSPRTPIHAFHTDNLNNLSGRKTAFARPIHSPL